MHAGHIARHEVGRALDALEAAADHTGKSFAQPGFAQTGRSFQEHVAAADQRHGKAMNNGFHPYQQLADLRLQVGFQS